MCGCRRLKEATGRLVVAWVLASACLTGHLAHLWKGAPVWLHLFGRPSVHAAMSALALVGVYPTAAFTSPVPFALSLALCPCLCFPCALCSAFRPSLFLPLFVVALSSAFCPYLPLPCFCLCHFLLLPCALLPHPFFAFTSFSACLGSASPWWRTDLKQQWTLCTG